MTVPVVLMGVLGVATVVGGVVVSIALWLDKERARRGRWRISERTLHTMEACGGWLGSLMARRALRHKSRKASYRVVAGLIGAVHVLAWVILVWWAIGTGGARAA